MLSWSLCKLTGAQEALWEVTCLQGDVSAGGVMGRVGGKGKSVAFAKKRFQLYLSGSGEEVQGD